MGQSLGMSQFMHDYLIKLTIEISFGKSVRRNYTGIAGTISQAHDSPILNLALCRADVFIRQAGQYRISAPKPC